MIALEFRLPEAVKVEGVVHMHKWGGRGTEE